MENLTYGICRLTVIFIKAEANQAAPTLSQLLFGEHYTVLESSHDGQWLKIEQYFDNTTGWIAASQHFEISEAYFHQINASDYKVCLDISASILFKKSKLQIILGSVLPISTNEIFKMEEQLAFNGASKSLSQKRDQEFFLEILEKYLNSPWLPGGKSPVGIDMAGLIQQAAKISGVRLKRFLAAQANQGETVGMEEEWQPGDVIFQGKGTPAVAVIYAGEDKYFVMDGYLQKQNISKNSLNDIICVRRYFKT